MINSLIPLLTTRIKTTYKRVRSLDFSGNQIFKSSPRTIVEEGDFTKLINHKEGVYVRVPIYFTASDRVVWDYFGITMNRENRVYAPLSELEDRLGISMKTACICIGVLKEHDYIKPLSSSFFIVNPNVIAKCTAEKRLKLIDEYTDLPESPTADSVREESEMYFSSRVRRKKVKSE